MRFVDEGAKRVIGGALSALVLAGGCGAPAPRAAESPRASQTTDETAAETTPNQEPPPTADVQQAGPVSRGDAPSEASSPDALVRAARACQDGDLAGLRALVPSEVGANARNDQGWPL